MRCGDCLHWTRKGDRILGDYKADHTQEVRIDVGACELLNNDFCCDGCATGALAGCTAGGGFESVANFGCVLFEQRRTTT